MLNTTDNRDTAYLANSSSMIPPLTANTGGDAPPFFYDSAAHHNFGAQNLPLK